MDNAKIIQNNVEAAIARNGESRKSISEKTGIPYTTLTRRLQDGMTFTLSEIAKLSDALEVSPNDLVSPFMFSNNQAA